MHQTQIHSAPILNDLYGRSHRYLRVSLTDRCNLRCRYCMPEFHSNWMKQDQLLTETEWKRILSICSKLGIEKIRFTGGEPLLSPLLLPLIEFAKSLPYVKTTALTTNGIYLSQKANELKQAGLDAVNISIDSLRRETFFQITKRNQLDDVLRGIDTVLEIGIAKVKLNVVVMRGVNDAEILDFVEWTRTLPLSVRFIEYMPFPGTQYQPTQTITGNEILKRIENHYSVVPIESSSQSDTAVLYQVDGFIGTFGLISPMSHAFCDSCNRLRITAEGKIKACLLDSNEVGLRDAMRTGESDFEVESLLRAALLSKPSSHSVTTTGTQQRPMHSTGG